MSTDAPLKSPAPSHPLETKPAHPATALTGSIVFLGLLFLGIQGLIDQSLEHSRPGLGPDGHSALGYRLLVEELRLRGHQVRVVFKNQRMDDEIGSWHEREQTAHILLEPTGGQLFRLNELRFGRTGIPRADTVLIVLKKWHGQFDPQSPSVATSAAPIPVAENSMNWHVLSGFLLGSPRMQGGGPTDDEWITDIDKGAFRGEDDLVDALDFGLYAHGGLRTFGENQMERSALAYGSAPLLIEFEPRGGDFFSEGFPRTFVLSDGDFLANHGLWREGSTELLGAILARIAPEQMPIVLHAFEGAPQSHGLWVRLLQPPWNALLLWLCLALLVFAAAGQARLPVFPKQSTTAASAAVPWALEIARNLARGSRSRRAQSAEASYRALFEAAAAPSSAARNRRTSHSRPRPRALPRDAAPGLREAADYVAVAAADWPPPISVAETHLKNPTPAPTSRPA